MTPVLESDREALRKIKWCAGSPGVGIEFNDTVAAQIIAEARDKACEECPKVKVARALVVALEGAQSILDQYLCCLSIKMVQIAIAEAKEANL